MPTTNDTPPAQRLFGHYELLGEIARGGMGVVYKARQTKLNRLVALKMIRSGELADEEQVKRFYAEAEAAAKLDHPGIVPVYEVGEIDGQHFFSMALVQGQSLNDRVRSAGPLPPRIAAKFLQAIAHAVHFAHDEGIVHRDIKPHNILLDEKERPRVTDFGLAKQTHGSSELTATGQVLGTPSYMPPEQAAGKTDEVGVSADMYSMGATLYYLLTGRPPFQASSLAETIRQVVEAQPVPLRRLNPEVPRDLETICLKCLRKEPEKRYASARDLAEDLGCWLNDKPITARPVGRIERTWLWCKRRPALIGLSLVFLVLSVVGTLAGTFVALEQRNQARIEGLVGQLVTAQPDQLYPIIKELDNDPEISGQLLSPLLSLKPRTPGERQSQLHARIAMVSRDDSNLEPLVDELNSCSFAYIGPICRQFPDAGDPRCDELVARFRKRMRDEAEDLPRRFRSAIALAIYEPWPDDNSWTAQDLKFLAEQLVSSNPESQPLLRRYLKDLSAKLLPDLGVIFANTMATDAQRLSAANAFADYASDIANSPNFSWSQRRNSSRCCIRLWRPKPHLAQSRNSARSLPLCHQRNWAPWIECRMVNAAQMLPWRCCG